MLYVYNKKHVNISKLYYIIDIDDYEMFIVHDIYDILYNIIVIIQYPDHYYHRHHINKTLYSTHIQ